MSYAPTNPRPRSIISSHPWWRSDPSHQQILTQALSRPMQKKGSLSQLSRYFDSRTRFNCQRCLSTSLSPVQRSSREIFDDPSILPYYLSPSEEAALSSEDRRSFEAVRAKYSVARTGRTPTIYRITDFTYCDDLGRIYHRGDPNLKQDATILYFSQYSLTKGQNYRNASWFFGPKGDVFMSAYIGVGYAGYDPDVQQRLYSSLKYDVHHVEENKFDIRPSTLLPLPTWMHLRWVHAADHNSTQNNLFYHDKVKGLIW